MATNGIYIYGIVPNFYGAEHFRSLEYAGVYAISLHKISAIVSDIEIELFTHSKSESPDNKPLKYQSTVEQIISLGFNMILPVKAGTYVNTRQEVLTILKKGHDLFISSFNHIENMTEVNLSVAWSDLDEQLKDLSTHPEIVELRDSIIKKNGSLSQADLVRTGILVRDRMNERNKEVELKILNGLTSLSTNLKLHEVLNDQIISNAAFLIKRNLKDKFTQMVGQFDKEFNGMLTLKLTGPLPCYSFCTIEVKELSPEKIACAKKVPVLDTDLSGAAVRRAFPDSASFT